MVSRVLLLTLAVKASADCGDPAKFRAAKLATCSLNECVADPTADCDYLCGEDCCSTRVGDNCGMAKESAPAPITEAELDKLIAAQSSVTSEGGDTGATCDDTRLCAKDLTCCRWNNLLGANYLAGQCGEMCTMAVTDPTTCSADSECDKAQSCCRWNNLKGEFDAAGVCGDYCTLGGPIDPPTTCSADSECDKTQSCCRWNNVKGKFDAAGTCGDVCASAGPTDPGCPDGCTPESTDRIPERKQLLFGTPPGSCPAGCMPM